MNTTSTLTDRICSVALMAMAALPIAALSTTAYAASVKVSDLNLTTSEGVAAFQQRAHRVSVNYCSSVGTLSLTATAACRKGVTAELNEKLDALRTAQAARTATFAAR